MSAENSAQPKPDPADNRQASLEPSSASTDESTDDDVLKKGAWTAEEDAQLFKLVQVVYSACYKLSPSIWCTVQTCHPVSEGADMYDFLTGNGPHFDIYFANEGARPQELGTDCGTNQRAHREKLQTL